MLAQDFTQSPFSNEVCHTVGVDDSTIDSHPQSRDRLTMAVNGFDLELILLSVFEMSAPCLFTRLRVLRRSCSLHLPLPGVLDNALRAMQQLAMLDLSEDVVSNAKDGLCQLCNQWDQMYHLGNANPSVILIIQLCRSRYRELLWDLLTYAKHNFAWKVRQNAALFVCDLVVFGETELASTLHVGACERYRKIVWRGSEPAEMYEMLHYEVNAEFRYKMMQFNAALAAGDIQWLVGTVPENRRNPRMFSHRRVPTTPMAPPEIDSPVDIRDIRVWERLFPGQIQSYHISELQVRRR